MSLRHPMTFCLLLWLFLLCKLNAHCAPIALFVYTAQPGTGPMHMSIRIHWSLSAWFSVGWVLPKTCSRLIIQRKNKKFFFPLFVFFHADRSSFFSNIKFLLVASIVFLRHDLFSMFIVIVVVIEDWYKNLLWSDLIYAFWLRRIVYYLSFLFSSFLLLLLLLFVLFLFYNFLVHASFSIGRFHRNRHVSC